MPAYRNRVSGFHFCHHLCSLYPLAKKKSIPLLFVALRKSLAIWVLTLKEGVTCFVVVLNSHHDKIVNDDGISERCQSWKANKMILSILISSKLIIPKVMAC